MTYEEHLGWAKERALEYLPDNPDQAFTSMVSDLRKHPGLENHPDITTGAHQLTSGLLDPERMRLWIEGFR